MGPYFFVIHIPLSLHLLVFCVYCFFPVVFLQTQCRCELIRLLSTHHSHTLIRLMSTPSPLDGSLGHSCSEAALTLPLILIIRLCCVAVTLSRCCARRAGPKSCVSFSAPSWRASALTVAWALRPESGRHAGSFTHTSLGNRTMHLVGGWETRGWGAGRQLEASYAPHRHVSHAAVLSSVTLSSSGPFHVYLS